MGIGFSTVKKMMQSVTDAPISDKAVYRMIQYIEETVKNDTKLAVDLLSQYNKLRELQGLDKKKRISADIMTEAMKMEANLAQ